MFNRKESIRKANVKLRENRKARGECIRCGKINDRVGKANCSDCQSSINQDVKNCRKRKKLLK